MRYQRLLRNCKAISPIFATLILIAIAVIAGVVVYMFTSGTLATMTSGGVAGTEKVAVQGVTLSQSGGVTVYAQSTNNMAVTITSISIKNTNGDIVWQGAPVSGSILSTGALATIANSTAVTGITTGNPYSITLVSTKGGAFVSSGIIAG